MGEQQSNNELSLRKAFNIYEAECNQSCDECPLGKKAELAPLDIEAISQSYTLCEHFDIIRVSLLGQELLKKLFVKAVT